MVGLGWAGLVFEGELGWAGLGVGWMEVDRGGKVWKGWKGVTRVESCGKGWKGGRFGRSDRGGGWTGVKK